MKEFLKANRKAKNQEVVTALAKKGITITANYVGNIKATHNKRGRAVRKVVAKGGIGIPDLKAAWLSSRLQGASRRPQRPSQWLRNQGHRVRQGQNN